MKICVRMFLIPCFLILAFISCDTGQSLGNNQEINLTRVEWVIENIDPSYWKTSTDGTVFLNFWLHYSDENLEAEDIEYIKVTNSENTFWLFSDSELIKQYLYTEENFFGGYLRLFSNFDSGNAIGIGKYDFEVKLKNGNSDTFVFDVPSPGSTLREVHDAVYSEDSGFNISTPDWAQHLPRRANISSGYFDTINETIEISFSVNDDLVNNAFLFYYNSNAEPIGYTETFVLQEFEPDGYASYINNGINFYTDGTNNSVQITSDDIHLYNEMNNIQDIESFTIVLTDGKQYSYMNQFAYDCRSLSERFIF